jgi:hypothetical protein
MIRRFSLTIRLMCLVLLSQVCQTCLFAEQPAKHALFVAVSKYQHAEMNKPELQYPEDDATELADIFRKGGYTVDLILGEKATQKAIRDKLATVNKKGNAEGAIVIGLFGHGVEFQGTSEACFCPYDTSIRDVKDAQGKPVFGNNRQPLIEPDPDSLIKMGELLSALSKSPAGNRVLLADCCRNSPNRARGRAFGANVKLTDLPKNTAALFACSENEQAFEHQDWKHGAFSKCLIEELKTLSENGKVTAGTLADNLVPKVQNLVASVTKGSAKQTVNSLVSNRVDLQLGQVVANMPELPSAKDNHPVKSAQPSIAVATKVVVNKACNGYTLQPTENPPTGNSTHIKEGIIGLVKEIGSTNYIRVEFTELNNRSYWIPKDSVE